MLKWLKNWIDPKCDVCGERNLVHTADGVGLIFCRKCHRNKRNERSVK